MIMIMKPRSTMADYDSDDERAFRAEMHAMREKALRDAIMPPWKVVQLMTQNIDSESKKVNYNPKKDTNWCNLPMEMRRECVKWMDFQTRTSLSVTSKTENSLVDSSSKYKLGSFRIYHCGLGFVLSADPNNPNRAKQSVLDRRIGLKKAEFEVSVTQRQVANNLFQILKKCDIHSFELMNLDKLFRVNRDIMLKIAKLAPFRFDIFTTEDTDLILYMFFLKNCQAVERINFCDKAIPLREILKLPVVINAKELRFFNVDQIALIWEFVQKWIDNDAEVGKLVQFHTNEQNVVESFAKKFADRIIDKTGDCVRIRTDVVSTKIVFKKLAFSDYGGPRYFCKVIPIEWSKGRSRKSDPWFTSLYRSDCVLRSLSRIDSSDDDAYYYYDSDSD